MDSKILIVLLVGIIFLSGCCGTVPSSVQNPLVDVVSSSDMSIESISWGDYSDNQIILNILVKSNVDKDRIYAIYDAYGTKISSYDDILSPNSDVWQAYQIKNVSNIIGMNSLKLCFWTYSQNESQKTCISKAMTPISISFSVEPKTIQFSISPTNNSEVKNITIKNTGTVNITLYSYGYSTSSNSNVSSKFSNYIYISNTSGKGYSPGVIIAPGQSTQLQVSSEFYSPEGGNSCDNDDVTWGLTLCHDMAGMDYSGQNVPQCVYGRNQEVTVYTSCN